MTQLEKADRIMPCECRLLARKNAGWTGKSHSDIAKESGLSRTMVSELSLRTTWVGIPMGIPDSFAKSCGVSLERPSAALKLLRRRKMIWVINANGNQARLYQEIFRKIKAKRK